ncbi:CAP domain-containing protein [Microbaculum marinum]|uniref:CAP domain-containing protein n=1 Tax=Microbaculum marinum TaxID=1764581 RepID=A0AAW9RVT5_9HYPH
MRGSGGAYGTRPSARAALACLALVAPLTGCTGASQGVQPIAVSSGDAAGSVSAYRASNGRGPVTANARLNALAARQALAMAKRGTLSHTLDGSLQTRLKNGGYAWFVAVENVSAGYDTFDAVLAGWTTSPGHRANLLERDVSEIGVGAARADDRYGSYWALILASPEAAAGSGMLAAGG